MITKIRFDRKPPVWCNAADRALSCRTDTEGQLGVVRQRSITAKLQIEQIVQEAIAAEADDLLRVHLLDKGAGSRHRRHRGTDVREAPSGNRVPNILDGRVVVGRYPPEQSVAVDVQRLREAYVRVVPTETPADAIIGPLNERPEIVGDPATGKQAHLLHREVIVGREMRSWSLLLIGRSIGKSRFQHDREGRAIPIAAAQCVATQLEAAAEGGQLQKGGMASRTRLAGLARVERQRRC